LAALQESYAGLERKVEERTHELETRSHELAQSVGELRALGEVTQAVNSTLDLATVLSTIVVKAVELSGTEAGSIYVVDSTTQGLQLRASHGMSEELIAELNRQGVDLSEKTIADAAAQRAPVQTPDLKDAAPSPVLNILLLQKTPIDRPRQLHQRVFHIDDLVQPRAEQITRSCTCFFGRIAPSDAATESCFSIRGNRENEFATFQGLRHGNLAISSQQSRQKTTLAQWVRNSSRATL
jgi:hypothetical protein